ncbi:MAG: hypothetical protein AB8B97_10180, partial [Granulosicoccus sp.]
TLRSQPTAVEQQRVSDLQEQFQQQAQKDPAGFRQALQAAFGDKASPAKIDQLLDLALAGKLPMPSNIQFVDAGSLGSNAFGAYDSGNGGSLYLDRSLLSDPAKLQSVFNEEMGHHLDALLGGADAAGDEGAVFSRTLEEGKLSQTELTALKNENDHGVIQIEGRWVQVEFNEEGGDESGGGGDESGGGDSGSSDSGGGAESGGGADSGGGGECSVDSGGGNSGGSGGSESSNDDGGSDTGDTGGECSAGGDNGGGPPGTGGGGAPDTGGGGPPGTGGGGAPDTGGGGPPGTGGGGAPDTGGGGPPGTGGGGAPDTGGGGPPGTGGGGPPDTGGGSPPDTGGGSPPDTGGGSPPDTGGGGPPDTGGGSPPDTGGGSPPDTGGGGPPPGGDEEVPESRSPLPTEPEPEKKSFWSRGLDGLQTALDFAGFIPGLGAIPDLVNAGVHLARGNKSEAAISAAAAIPLGGDAFKAGTMAVRSADRLNDTRRAGGASATPKEGIYEFPDASAGGKPYVGQSGNITNRLQQHEKSGRLNPGTETTTEVLGGKTAREVAEHQRIQELTNGVPARHSPDVANKVDPIGPARQHLLP